ICRSSRHSTYVLVSPHSIYFFSFTHTPTSEIYTLSLHDALPISGRIKGNRDRQARGRQNQPGRWIPDPRLPPVRGTGEAYPQRGDRKSTRLNSSHLGISYAVFCLKKKKTKSNTTT